MLLQLTLEAGMPIFSDPLLFNNILWDNWAGYRYLTGISGIGLPNDPMSINVWDLGIGDGSGTLTGDPSNLVGVDPLFVSTYDTLVQILPWRANVNFAGAGIVAVNLPSGGLPGDYHILTYNSPAKNRAVEELGEVWAPIFDFDGEIRPGWNGFDAGADEFDLPFPTTFILDDFNRGNGSLGGNWSGATNPGVYRIDNQEAQVRSSGGIWWSGQTFGVNQEAYFTMTKIVPTASEHALLLKLNGTAPTSNNASYIKVAYNPSSASVVVSTKAARVNPVVQATVPVNFAVGDILGARAETGGWVILYKNGEPFSSLNVQNTWTPTQGNSNVGVNYIGPTTQNDARFDDFGGGNVP
jgi:hypothetical protein